MLPRCSTTTLAQRPPVTASSHQGSWNNKTGEEQGEDNHIPEVRAPVQLSGTARFDTGYYARTDERLVKEYEHLANSATTKCRGSAKKSVHRSSAIRSNHYFRR